MRNINIFRTDVKDHIIPRHILLQAMRLSPGADWTDRETQAYNYLKRWALNQENRTEPTTLSWGGIEIPREVYNKAVELSPGKSTTDQRTLAFKYLKNWVLENKNGNEERHS